MYYGKCVLVLGMRGVNGLAELESGDKGPNEVERGVVGVCKLLLGITGGRWV